MKVHVYPEDMLLPFLAKLAGRPVRWVETRAEHILCSCHSRDQHHEAEIAFDESGRILAFSDSFVVDCGAWNPLGVAVVYNTAAHLAGPYKIGHFSVEARVAATNKVPNAPYRGAGRPEAVQVMERLMDLAARELGLEPAEVRRRNMVPAAEMPYSVGIPYRDGEPIVYDSGNYPEALAQALAALGGVEAFRARQKEARAAGRFLGLGLGCYTEGTGVGSFEGATVRIDPTGRIYVSSGACPHGQGMKRSSSQVAADAWGVEPERIITAFGDTASIPMGFGTIASRTTVTVSAAIHYASRKLRDKVFAIAGHKLECAVADLELRDGKVGVVGVPGAERHAGRGGARGAARLGQRPPAGHRARPAGNPLLRAADRDLGVRGACRHSGSGHRDRPRCDRALRRLPRLRRAREPHAGRGADRGRRGAGHRRGDFRGDRLRCRRPAAFRYIHGLHDAIASDVPEIVLVHQEIRSPLNPLGVKGLGRGGAISPPVVVANAVCDALAHLGIEINSTPVKPESLLWEIQSKTQIYGGSHENEQAFRYRSPRPAGPALSFTAAHAQPKPAAPTTLSFNWEGAYGRANILVWPFRRAGATSSCHAVHRGTVKLDNKEKLFSIMDSAFATGDGRVLMGTQVDRGGLRHLPAARLRRHPGLFSEIPNGATEYAQRCSIPR